MKYNNPTDIYFLPFFFSLPFSKYIAPTALALSTSLISTSLPRAEIKKHIAFFSASTPMGAIISYIVLSAFGESLGGGGDGYVKMTGIALLVSVSFIVNLLCFSLFLCDGQGRGNISDMFCSYTFPLHRHMFITPRQSVSAYCTIFDPFLPLISVAKLRSPPVRKNEK